MRKSNRNSLILAVLLLTSTLCFAEPPNSNIVPATPEQIGEKAANITVSQPGGTKILSLDPKVDAGYDKQTPTERQPIPIPSSPPSEITQRTDSRPMPEPVQQDTDKKMEGDSPAPDDTFMQEESPAMYGAVDDNTPAYDDDQSAKKFFRNSAKIENLTKRLKEFKNEPQIVEDEDYQAVEISLKDVSRVVCFTNITRTIYSKEKGIEIKTVDKNAFIKNLPKEKVDPATGRIAVEYDTRPKEVYVVCGEKTFSLLLIPKDVPANTIYLKSSYVNKEKAFEFEKSNDYENMILTLIKAAYHEDIPAGYETEDIDKVFREYQEIRLVHHRNYKGVMFEVQEYILTAKKELSINEITLIEAISPKNPLAVSIVSPLLRANEQSRVFIVRLLKDE